MSKRTVDPISNERVGLRLLTAADLPMTLAWRNQDDIRRWFFYSAIIQPEQHAAWFERYAQRDDDFVFIIEERQSLHRPVGQLAVYNVDWSTRRAEYGRLIIGDAEARGRGLARDATQLAIELSHSTLHLQQLYMEVYADNMASIRTCVACGFVEDSRQDGIIHMHRDLGPGNASTPAGEQ